MEDSVSSLELVKICAHNYSPMPHTLPFCAPIGECVLIRSNTVVPKLGAPSAQPLGHFGFSVIYEHRILNI